MSNRPEHLEPEGLPTFIISVGTQVVLKSAKRVPDSDIVKPAGSVAEVLDAPASNSRPYLIRFVDGTTMRVKFAELVIRKRELDEELVTPGPDLRQFVILRVAVGSQAFGLATDASDEDRRGVFLPPADLTWSLFKPPEQVEYASDGVEEVDWELEKFLRLALQANPNILETLWSPLVLHITDLGQELRNLRASFLSRHLYKTYSGYVLSQFRLMKKNHDRKGTYKTKHAMHLIRLLYSGIHALRTGEILVDVGDYREELLRIKAGELSFEEVRTKALQLDQLFQEAFAVTALPERPDYERINRFLVHARRRMVDDAGTGQAG
jgi:predicted nucleotidyltransferase